LISGLSFQVLADKGFDSDRVRASIAKAGAEAVIPSNRSRAQAIPYDKHIYEERNLVEIFAGSPRATRRLRSHLPPCYSWSAP
jgi:transposase